MCAPSHLPLERWNPGRRPYQESQAMLSKARFSAPLFALAGAIVVFTAAGIARADGPRDHALFGAIRSGDPALLESHLREGTPVNVHWVAR